MHIPEDALILSHLEISEYMDADGQLMTYWHAVDSDGEDLPLERMLKVFKTVEAMAMAPMLAAFVLDYIAGD